MLQHRAIRAARPRPEDRVSRAARLVVPPQGVVVPPQEEAQVPDVAPLLRRYNEFVLEKNLRTSTTYNLHRPLLNRLLLRTRSGSRRLPRALPSLRPMAWRRLYRTAVALPILSVFVLLAAAQEQQYEQFRDSDKRWRMVVLTTEQERELGLAGREVLLQPYVSPTTDSVKPPAAPSPAAPNIAKKNPPQNSEEVVITDATAETGAGAILGRRDKFFGPLFPAMEELVVQILLQVPGAVEAAEEVDRRWTTAGELGGGSGAVGGADEDSSGEGLSERESPPTPIEQLLLARARARGGRTRASATSSEVDEATASSLLPDNNHKTTLSSLQRSLSAPPTASSWLRRPAPRWRLWFVHDATVNAVVLPSGDIIVFTGMLAKCHICCSVTECWRIGSMSVLMPESWREGWEGGGIGGSEAGGRWRALAGGTGVRGVMATPILSGVVLQHSATARTKSPPFWRTRSRTCCSDIPPSRCRSIC